MIGAIIHSLEDAIADRLPAHTRFGLVEQWNTDQGLRPIQYQGGGQGVQVIDDKSLDLSYWRLRAAVEQRTGDDCDEVTLLYPLRLVFLVDRTSDVCADMGGALGEIMLGIRLMERAVQTAIPGASATIVSMRAEGDTSRAVAAEIPGINLPPQRALAFIDIALSITGDTDCLSNCGPYTGSEVVPSDACYYLRVCGTAEEGQVPTYEAGRTVWATPGTGPAGSGDVVGPASAVNNNFASFNLTTGKLIKDSGVNAASFDAAGAAAAAQAAAISSASSDATTKANAAQAAAIASAASDATTKANAAQAFAIQRANHTGTQLAVTVSDFNAAALAAAPAETATTIGALINGATSKTTPVDADMVGLMDSAAANILKKLSWSNIKATLKTYFDTLYPSGSGTSTGTNTGDQTSVSGNAGTATALQTGRTINGVTFDGTANIVTGESVTPFLVRATTPFPYTNLPAAANFFQDTAFPSVFPVDLTHATQARIYVYTATTGSAGSKLSIKYKTGAWSATAGDYSDIGTSEVAATVSAANTFTDSGWVNLAAGAKAEIYVSVFGLGGNGVADPTFNILGVQFR